MRGSLLVVEDDTSLLESLHSTLTALGLSVGKAATGEYALREMNVHNYDVVLLDLNMPGMGGMAACRAMREQHPDISIIVLTVRDREDDKVAALQAGADDYVTKPFHLPEVIARIGAAFRRTERDRKDPGDIITVASVSLDVAGHIVKKDGERIHLTPTEFDLLHALMKQAGRPISHRTLLTTVWGPDYGNEREYLRTYINQLRKKIEDDPTHPTRVLTENYIGYRFAVPD